MEESTTNGNTANGRGKSGKRSRAEEKKRRQALIDEYRAKHAKPAEPIGHPPGGLLDSDLPFRGKMYRFDLGEGRSLQGANRGQTLRDALGRGKGSASCPRKKIEYPLTVSRLSGIV